MTNVLYDALIGAREDSDAPLLVSATGDETSHFANHAALDAVRLWPAVLEGPMQPDLSWRRTRRSVPRARTRWHSIWRASGRGWCSCL